MHHSEGKNSCCHVIEHDSGALGEFLQLAHRRRLDDVEPSKKYKTGEESFPCQRDGDEGDELSGDLVDYDELGIFAAGGTRYAGGGGDADQGDECCQGDGGWGAEFGRQDVHECGPDCDCGYRGPGAGAGVEAANAEESGRQDCPLRGARVFRLCAAVGKRRACGSGLHDSSSGSSGLRSRMASSASVTGEEITYWPLAHLPRSMRRQRSLQKGKSASVLLTDFLQMGQRSLTVRLRGMRFVL